MILTDECTPGDKIKLSISDEMIEIEVFGGCAEFTEFIYLSKAKARAMGYQLLSLAELID